MVAEGLAASVLQFSLGILVVLELRWDAPVPPVIWTTARNWRVGDASPAFSAPFGPIPLMVAKNSSFSWNVNSGSTRLLFNLSGA